MRNITFTLFFSDFIEVVFLRHHKIVKVFYALQGRAQEYEGRGGAILKSGLHVLRCSVSPENYGEDHFFPKS